MRNVRCTSFFVMVLLALPIISCRGTGTGTEGTKASPYVVPGAFEPTGLTDTDRTIARKIRKNHNNTLKPRREFRLLSRVLNYISGLRTDRIADRVRGTGARLIPLLTEREQPESDLGHWYRIRGTPVSVPQQKPYQGQLDVGADLQQFLLKNPSGFDEEGKNAYFEVISLKPLSGLRPSDRILEVDGLLWKTWSISNGGTGRFEKTDQTRVPTFLVTDYRVVKDR